MLVFGFSILQVGGTHTRIVHVRVSFVLYKEKKKKEMNLKTSMEMVRECGWELN